MTEAALWRTDWYLEHASPRTAPIDLIESALGGAVAANEYRAHAEPVATSKVLLAARGDSTSSASEGTAPRSPVRLAEWDGYVTEIGEASFKAVLRGIAGGGVEGKRHEGEIALDELGQSDRQLLRPGAMFRICILSEVDDDERPKRFAKVIFRRLPAYRQYELEAADKRSAERHRRIRVE